MQILDSRTLSHMIERLHRLQPATKAVWGRMNAHQMLCHLNDSFGLAMGQKTASEEMTFFSRTVVRWIALRAPFQWPQGVPTRPEMDQLAGGTPPLEFNRDKAELVSLMERFIEQPRKFEFSRHPVFGELIEWEWMRWGFLHADHHFRQFGI